MTDSNTTSPTTTIIRPDQIRTIGFHFGIGIIQAWAVLMIVGAAFIALLHPLFPADDSDVSRFDRSGFTIMTDAKTGLQYLRAGNSLTPRIDKDGHQMRAP